MNLTVTVNQLENSEVEIIGEIATADFASFRAKAITNLNGEAKIDGFRPGHVPEAVLVQTLGDDAILMEMADLALREAYPEIILEHKIDALGRPDIQITKIAKDNPLGFKIKTAVSPKVDLGNYQDAVKKALAEKVEVAPITDADLEQVLTEIQKNYAHQEYHKNNPEDHGHDHPELPLPEINDEFATKVGKFTDLADMKAKITDNLKFEREREAANKKRIKVVEALVSTTTVTPPQILIDHEQNTMMSELKGRIEAAGLNFADYLTHIKKTEEEVRDGWKDEATKQVKIGLAINEVAKQEKIKPTTEEVESETKKLMEHYKDIPEDRARDYVANLIINQKVLTFLEGLK